MKGLLLKFDNWSRNIFQVLFKEMDYSQWEMDVFYWESYNDFESTVDFNQYDEIPSEFAKYQLLQKKTVIHPEFAKILFRFKGSSKNEVKTYGHFIHSSYFLSLVIIDHRNIEICGIDDGFLKKVVENFLNSDLENKRIKELNSIPFSAALNPWRSKNESNIFDESET